MKIDQNPFVFMGGTFDPIHNGHLRSALELQQWLGCEQVCLVPSGQPVHKHYDVCPAQHRLEMVRLAAQDAWRLSVDDREVSSDTPSYTLKTLHSYREELGSDRSIIMVVGMDAYLTLPTWQGWDTFLSLCHIIAVARPGYDYRPDAVMDNYTRAHQVNNAQKLKDEPYGHVLIHELTPLGISATQIRHLIQLGQTPRFLLPDQVWEYIKHNKLYGFK